MVYNYVKEWAFDEDAPWTTMNQNKNDPVRRDKKKPVRVPPIFDWTFFRGDKVQIMSGPDAGKQGIVNGIVKQRNWVFVYGLNSVGLGFMLDFVMELFQISFFK